MADGRLKIDIRRNRILEILKEKGRVLVTELSQELGVTPVTIRTDLDALEADGRLERVQGGAIMKPRPAAQGWDAGSEDEEKWAIARYAAEQLPDGCTLFINSGSTTRCLARALKKRRNLNVVTNSLAVAAELGTLPSVHVILLGGEINVQNGFTFGEDAQKQLQQYQADWAVLSVDGVSVSGGITTFHAEEASVNRIMMERSRGILIVADHTKIGRTGFTYLHGIDAAVRLVTDRNCSEESLRELEYKGMHVERV